MCGSVCPHVGTDAAAAAAAPAAVDYSTQQYSNAQQYPQGQQAPPQQVCVLKGLFSVCTNRLLLISVRCVCHFLCLCVSVYAAACLWVCVCVCVWLWLFVLTFGTVTLCSSIFILEQGVGGQQAASTTTNTYPFFTNYPWNQATQAWESKGIGACESGGGSLTRVIQI